VATARLTAEIVVKRDFLKGEFPVVRMIPMGLMTERVFEAPIVYGKGLLRALQRQKGEDDVGTIFS
jgi:hypothetical protein